MATKAKAWSFTVIDEACVLYPAPLRSCLMYLAGACRARWTNEIHGEWMRHVAANHPDIQPSQIQRVRDLMDRNVLDCLVTGREHVTETLELPDPDDRHVLAAAIHGGAEVIVTFDLKDFPASKLETFGVRARRPDDFLAELLETSPQFVLQAAEQRASLKNPPMDAALLDSLARQRLAQAVAKLRAFAESI